MLSIPLQTNIRVEWDPSLPAELRECVSPGIERWSFMLPRWVNRLCILPNHDTDDTIVSITVRRQYRDVTLRVSPILINELPAERERVILHEFCHAFTSPLKGVAVDAMREIFPEETPGRRIFEEWLEREHEAATEDLADVIARGPFLRPEYSASFLQMPERELLCYIKLQAAQAEADRRGLVTPNGKAKKSPASP